MLADRTEKYRYYRSQGQKAAADRESRPAPALLWRCVLRTENGRLTSVAGRASRWWILTICPKDGGEVFEKVCADPHTVLAYATISGAGGEGGVPLLSGRGGGRQGPSDAVRPGVQQGKRVLPEVSTKCTFDPACKNATRLSGLAHDAQVHYHDEAEPFRFDLSRMKKADEPRRGRGGARGGPYPQGVGRAGRGVPRITTTSISCAWGYLMNEFGLPLEQAIGWADGRFPEYDGDVAAIFRSCYADTEAHGRREAEPVSCQEGEKGEGRARLATPEEIEQFLATQAEFRKNVITGKEEMRHPEAEEFVELTDRLVNSLWSRMTKEGHTVRLCDVRSVLESEFVPEFNPFTEYFRSLPRGMG